jgi:hypothetical protein
MDINLLERCIQLTFPDLNFKMKNSYMNYVLHFNEKELSIF